MSGGKNDGEQRTLPPTKKKLDEARRKGQVATSRDMVGGAATAATLCLLMLGAGQFVAAGARLLDAAGTAVGLGLAAGLGLMGVAARDAVFGTAVPLVLAAPAAAVVAAIAALRGIPFSVDPVKPKTERVNPAEGFKRLFALRSLVELLKALLKAALVAAMLGAVLLLGLRELLLAPGCGLACVRTAFSALAHPMLAAAVAFFLAAGLADVGLQRWLFRRDMRMGVSEARRERKETEGDPKIRAARDRIRKGAGAAVARIGVAQATLVLHAGDGGAVVGIRYRRGETPAPAVVCRGEGERGTALRRRAETLCIPMLEDVSLARFLARRVPPGDYVPRSMYQPLAAALRMTGAI